MPTPEGYRIQKESQFSLYSMLANRFDIVVIFLLGLIEHTGVTSTMNNVAEDWVMSRSVVCNGIPGLTKEQREICRKNPEVTAAALDGLHVALSECQYQFMWNRWNCSSLTTSSLTQHSSVFMKRGFKETAFILAISTAGIVYSISRACSTGHLLSCGCDPSSYTQNSRAKVEDTQWKWSGCSYNIEYGMDFTKQFLDSREKAGDIQSTVNLHNNQVGRLVVANSMQIRCKCHGMSGSCELKTCWKVVPDFRVIGEYLKNRFRNAVVVTQSNFGNASPLSRIKGFRKKWHNRQKQLKHRNDRKSSMNNYELHLYYFQKSPNFCEKNVQEDVPGTVGRKCNRPSTGSDGCSSLCCGRGYNIVRQRGTERCSCKFHWCCFVQCQNCTVEEWITVCK